MSFELEFAATNFWTGPETSPRTQPQFRNGYDDTLKLVRKELEYLDTDGPVIIEVVTANGALDVRKDRMLAARAQVIHPGVRVSFRCKYGPLTYACDQYAEQWSGKPPSWQANLRAFALGLEALRAVNRHGISSAGQQYRGFQALAAGPSSAMTPRDALDVLRTHAGPPLSNEPDTPRILYRRASFNTHPDRNGGDRSRFDQVTAAGAALGFGTALNAAGGTE